MPTYKTPQYALGKHVSLVKLVGQAVAADGTLTDDATAGNTVDVTVLKKGLVDVINPVDEEINGDSSTVANHVTLYEDPTLSLEILAVNDGTDPEPLKQFVLTYGYIRYEYTIGTAGSARKSGGRRKRGRYTTNSTGRGPVMASLELVSCDTGQAAHSYEDPTP